MKIFKFEKEIDNKWYVVLPEWKGPKDDLEMVMGADTMLDILAQGEDFVYLTLSHKPFENYSFTLNFIGYESEGGIYMLNHELYNFEIWLCHVTEFVFGELPKVIYCKI